MTSKANAHIDQLKTVALLTQHDPELKREVEDVIWAYVGRTVLDRVHATDDLIAVLNRAGMRSKSMREMAAYVQAFLLTGAKP